MTDDPLAHRVRAAVDSVPTPAFPTALLAARIAAANAGRGRPARRPVLTLVGGGLLLAAALAVGVHKQFHFPPAVQRAMERLERSRGHAGPYVSYDVTPQSLEEVRKQTDFPIVIPRGMRIVSAFALPQGHGVSLLVERHGHDAKGPTRDQVAVDETWAKERAPKYPTVRINNDGSTQSVPTHRWRVGAVRLSVTEIVPRYHTYALELERATRAVRR